MPKNLNDARKREEIQTYVNALVVESANFYRAWLYGNEKPLERSESSRRELESGDRAYTVCS
jgi:hypothetical protein